MLKTLGIKINSKVDKKNQCVKGVEVESPSNLLATSRIGCPHWGPMLAYSGSWQFVFNIQEWDVNLKESSIQKSEVFSSFYYIGIWGKTKKENTLFSIFYVPINLQAKVSSAT